MTKQMVRDWIDFGDERGGTLFDRFKAAWLKLPAGIKDSDILYVTDNSIYFNRLETDQEWSQRTADERGWQEENDRITKLKRESHLFSEIQSALGEQLKYINSQWESIKTGQSMTTNASVPMPDGRIAALQISVIAREETKSVD